ncbi:Uncharacterised protein [Salmonella enterica subsp. arizonae]|uniref:Uncharacterized protein n=9 Tax=Salmonella enterica TaxID=28901 RepID=A0A3S4K484_SALER|nr:Uncharacterised protein [Salmonella enterica subsp. diarizonae]VEA76748.1 Uncharacterised protein [Salmonella enterica subsp. arizonae]VFS73101.1 Uncharacterised protein [Salmonella enterica subsp. diarizonae]
MHMRDMLVRGVQHTDVFYKDATNSCDETTSVTKTQMLRLREYSDVIGDRIFDNSNQKRNASRSEKPLTSEQREVFWNETLFYYGWNGRMYMQ